MISFVLTLGALYIVQAIVFVLILLFIARLIRVLKLNKNFYNNLFSNEFELYILLVILFFLSLVITIFLVYNSMILLNFNISIYIFIIYGLLRTILFILKKNKVIETIKKHF